VRRIINFVQNVPANQKRATQRLEEFVVRHPPRPDITARRGVGGARLERATSCCKARVAAAVYCRLSLVPLGKRLVARGCCPWFGLSLPRRFHAEPLYSFLDEALRIVRIDPLLLRVPMR
jgi:hypothetical protein